MTDNSIANNAHDALEDQHPQDWPALLETLYESETRFQEVFEHAAIGIALVSPAGRWLRVNAALCELLGYSAAELLTRTFQELTYLPDLESDLELARQLLVGVIPTYQIEKRYIHRQGHLIWSLLSVSLVRNRTGVPRYFIKQIQDITARKQTEAALRAANQELAERVATLEQHMQVMQLLTNMGEWLHACQTAGDVAAVAQQVFTTVCPTAAGVLVLGEVGGERVYRWGSEQPPQLPVVLDGCRAFAEGQPLADAERCLLCGAMRTSTGARPGLLCLPLLAPGLSLGALRVLNHTPPDVVAETATPPLTELQQQVVITVADQSALALASIQLRESLDRQATRDPLTGLFNRRFMEVALAQAIHRAQRRGGKIGLILLDLDHFKRVNDTFGHPAGDALLRAVADYLKGHIRAEDVACRYGGEEFLLILAEVTLETLVQRAEALRAGMCQLQVSYGTQPIGPVTLSIGVALYPDHGTTAEALVAAADAALYQAKQAGRNQVVIARLEARQPLDG